MKIFLYILSLIILLRAAYVSFLNSHTSVNLLVFRHLSLDLNLAFIIVAIFIFGTLFGVLFTTACTIKNKKAIKEYKRELEKKTVNAENESSKVKVLESKIEVLEKALASALEKNKEN